MPRRAKSPRRKRSILWRTRNIFLVMLLLFVAAAAGMVSVFWNKVELPEASPVLAETTYICSSEVTGTFTVLVPPTSASTTTSPSARWVAESAVAGPSPATSRPRSS